MAATMRQLLARSMLLAAFAARRGRRRHAPLDVPDGRTSIDAKKVHAVPASSSMAPAVRPAVVTAADVGAARLSAHAAAICAVALFAAALLSVYWRTTASI